MKASVDCPCCGSVLRVGWFFAFCDTCQQERLAPEVEELRRAGQVFDQAIMQQIERVLGGYYSNRE